MPRVNFIPCVAWVPKGVSKQLPDKVELTETELKRILKSSKNELEDILDPASDDDDVNDADTQATLVSGTSVENEYDMENYDNEPDSVTATIGLEDLELLPGNVYDPSKEGAEVDSEDDDDEIRSDDNLILVGHVDEDVASIEVYVYNSEEGYLYVHHEIMLSNLPLCLEWLDYLPDDTSKSGNLVAVASTDPVIELWDLDVLDSLKCKSKLGRRKSKKKKLSRVGHKDAVLSLSWNKQVKNVLASGSADHNVILWDLSTGQDVKTLNPHTEKVQSVTWHPYEKQTLLTGSSDKTARLFECESGDCKTYDIGQEVEIVAWNHFQPYNFLVGTETGDVICHDARSTEPVWKISAHDSAVSGLSLSSQCPGCLITVSEDKKS